MLGKVKRLAEASEAPKSAHSGTPLNSVRGSVALAIRVAALVGVLAGGIGGTVQLNKGVHAQAAAEVRAAVRVRADANEHALRIALAEIAHGIDRIRMWGVEAPERSEESFEQLAERLLVDMPELDAAGWIERVPRNQLLSHETAAKRMFPDYSVQEVDSSGNLRPATEREEYFPVTLVAPLEANRHTLGLDFGSSTVRRAVLNAARETGETRASFPINLVQEQNNQLSIVVLAPAHLTQAQDRGSPSGYAFGVIDMARFTRGVLTELDKGSSLTITTPTPTGNQVVFRTADSPDSAQTTLAVHRHVSALGQHWDLELRRPLPSPILSNLLIVGIALTLLVAGLLLRIMFSEQRARQTVAVRTKALEETVNALTESEAKSRDFAETAAEWFWETDRAGKSTFLSPGFGDYLDEHEPCVERLLDYFEKNDLRDDVERALIRGTAVFRTRLILIGSRKEVTFSARPFKDAAGNISGYRGVVSDLSDLLAAQEELATQRAENLFVGKIAILANEASSSHVCIEDAARTLCLEYGLPLSRSTLISDREEFHPGAWQRHTSSETQIPPATVARLNGERVPLSDLAHAALKSGQAQWSNQSAQERQCVVSALLPPLPHVTAGVVPLLSGDTMYGVIELFGALSDEATDRAREVSATIGVQIGIALARLRTQDELALSERNAREYTEIASDWWWETDDQLCFTRFGGNVATSGYRAEDLLGKTRESLHGNTMAEDPGWEQHLQTLAERRAFRDFELTGAHPDGSIGYYWLSGTPSFDLQGRFLGYRGTARDVTRYRIASREREQLRDQVRHFQKMQSLGQIVGGIAHDFNNILASILGYTSLAKGRIATGNYDPVQRYLGEVQTAGLRARDLVAQMLTFARAAPNASRPIAIAPIIDEVARLIRPTVTSALELSITCPAEVPPIVIDPVELHQVIMNLCINARDAVQGEGKLDIVVASKTVDGLTCPSCGTRFSGDFVEIAVSDTGSGIGPESMAAIFEPFYTTKDIGQGTGMGLSVVHGIAHENGGHVSVESTKGRGTRIALLIPPAGASISGTAEPFTEAPSARSKLGRIAVVDDEEAICRFLAELLSDAGHDVTTFSNSRVALEQFQRAPREFDLVLTDQTMPELSGTGLADAIWSFRPDAPIILISGYAQGINLERAKALGFASFLSKPIISETLLDVIEAILTSAPDR